MMIALSRVILATLVGALLVTPAAAQSRAQLDAIVAEALRNNLGLAQESLAVERAEAGVREARGRFFPELSLDARYSQQSGALDLGCPELNTCNTA